MLLYSTLFLHVIYTGTSDCSDYIGSNDCRCWLSFDDPLLSPL